MRRAPYARKNPKSSRTSVIGGDGHGSSYAPSLPRRSASHGRPRANGFLHRSGGPDSLSMTPSSALNAASRWRGSGRNRPTPRRATAMMPRMLYDTGRRSGSTSGSSTRRPGSAFGIADDATGGGDPRLQRRHPTRFKDLRDKRPRRVIPCTPGRGDRGVDVRHQAAGRQGLHVAAASPAHPARQGRPRRPRPLWPRASISLASTASTTTTCCAEVPRARHRADLPYRRPLLWRAQQPDQLHLQPHGHFAAAGTTSKALFLAAWTRRSPICASRSSRAASAGAASCSVTWSSIGAARRPGHGEHGPTSSIAAAAQLRRQVRLRRYRAELDKPTLPLEEDFLTGGMPPDLHPLQQIARSRTGSTSTPRRLLGCEADDRMNAVAFGKAMPRARG